MAQGICPSCGWETLEAVDIAKDAERPARPTGRHTLVLLECTRCAWFGSTTVQGFANQLVTAE